MRMLWLIAPLVLMPSVARAGLIVQVLDASMDAGSTGGVVDVVIRSDGLGSSTPLNPLGRFGYEFTISGASPSAGDLQFSVTQSNSEQTEAGPPAYVFLGDTDPGNFNQARTDTTTLTGGDIVRTDENFFELPTYRLLARISLEHIGSTIVGSHPFTISLNTTSGFTDFDRDDDAGTSNSYSFSTSDPDFKITALSGTVTVTATPEPSSLAMLGLGGIGGIVYAWLRRARRN